jgi:hypothetical protein
VAVLPLAVLEVANRAYLNAPIDELGACSVDVVDNELDSLDGAGGFVRPGAEHDGAPRPDRGELDDTKRGGDPMVEVDAKPA